MIEVKVTNKYAETLNLSTSKDLTLAEVTGLTPPAATINATPIATKDGSIFNSAYLENRNIVLTVYPRRSVEASRINLYRYFKAKQKARLSIKTAQREVWIDGYIETIDGNLYENPQALQISVICPDPYFKAKTEVKVNFANGSASINNTSDEETGAVFEITATGTASAPVITNTTTGETFELSTDLQSGDKITINTRRGEKAVTLTRSGTVTNILNDVTPGSKWLQLRTGANALTLTATTGADALGAAVTLQPIYEGI